MPEIFISYAREDTEFVKRLVESLTAEKRDVWVDFQDIPFASDWWEEIQSGIDASEAAVFVISPDSLASRYCSLEVNHALKNNKRLIPVVYREPNDQTAQPSKEVAALNWIFFKDPAAFNESLRQLLETVDTDQELLEQHTRLLMLARDWERNGHNRSFLLRGAELDELDDMLDQPNLTDLQREFLLESQQQQRRLDVYWRFGLGFFGGFLGVGFWAFSVFVSDQLITPLRFIYTSSLGQVFGLFIGVLSVLAGEIIFPLHERFSRPVLLMLRIVLCVVIGVVAWAVFRWLYLQEGSQLTQASVNTLIVSGFGLAFGFIARIVFKLPGWAATILTAVSIFVPMYVTFVGYQTGDTTFDPLIFFVNVPQLFSVGIPMVVLIALGANAQVMRRELRDLIQRLRVTRAKT